MAHTHPEDDLRLGIDPTIRVQIPVDQMHLEGDFSIPESPCGVVLFVHGSGSSRRNRRDRYLARVLRQAGLATLLFDLLGVGDGSSHAELLARRTLQVAKWTLQQRQVEGLELGYFGDGTGAAAAVMAAAQGPVQLRAIACRGGLVNLASAALERVQVPTLLIVGGRDSVVLDLNRQALEYLHCEKRLAIVEGASHRFEEPGALEAVSRLAGTWFAKHLCGRAQCGLTKPEADEITADQSGGQHPALGSNEFGLPKAA